MAETQRENIRLQVNGTLVQNQRPCSWSHRNAEFNSERDSGAELLRAPHSTNTVNRHLYRATGSRGRHYFSNEQSVMAQVNHGHHLSAFEVGAHGEVSPRLRRRVVGDNNGAVAAGSCHSSKAPPSDEESAIDTNHGQESDYSIEVDDEDDDVEYYLDDNVEEWARDRPMDSKYGYPIVIGSFFVHLVILGNSYAYGVFIVEYEDVFDASKFAVSLPGSIVQMLMMGLGFFSGRMSDIFGAQRMIFIGGLIITSGYLLGSFSTELWMIYLTHGVLVGFGSSISYFPAVAMISQWYDRKRALATGIAVAGSGIGGFIFGPVTQSILDHLGFRWALRILAIVTFVTISGASLLLRPRLKSTGSRSFKMTNFRDARFRLQFFANSIAAFGILVPFFYMPSWSEDVGLGGDWGAICVGIMNGGSAFGRIVLGFAADRFGRMPLFWGSFVAAGVGDIIWTGCEEKWNMALVSLLIGFGVGGFISLNPVVAADLYGLKDLPATVGLLVSGMAVGNLVGPSAMGAVYEVERKSVPVIAGALLIIGGIMVWAIRFIPIPQWRIEQLGLTLPDEEGAKQKDEDDDITMPPPAQPKAVEPTLKVDPLGESG